MKADFILDIFISKKIIIVSTKLALLPTAEECSYINNLIVSSYSFLTFKQIVCDNFYSDHFLHSCIIIVVIQVNKNFYIMQKRRNKKITT